jgi:hypothetical protein
MELDEYLSIENLHYYLAQEDEGRTVVFTCPACGGTVKIEAAEFVRKLFSGGLDIDCHHASSHRWRTASTHWETVGVDGSHPELPRVEGGQRSQLRGSVSPHVARGHSLYYIRY